MWAKPGKKKWGGTLASGEERLLVEQVNALGARVIGGPQRPGRQRKPIHKRGSVVESKVRPKVGGGAAHKGKKKTWQKGAKPMWGRSRAGKTQTGTARVTSSPVKKGKN